MTHHVLIKQGLYQIKDWPVENYSAFSSDGATGEIGHFTALVWANTTRVGCGAIEYFKDELYVKVNVREFVILC